MTPFISFLLTASCRTISIRCYCPPPAELVPLIASLSPLVEELALAFGDAIDSEATAGTIPLQYFSHLKHLLSLDIDADYTGDWTVKVSAMSELFLNLPFLKKIRLSVNRIEHDWSPLSKQDSIISPLDTFTLCYNPTFATGLHLFPSLPFVTDLEVGISPDLAAPHELTAFLLAISSNTTLSSVSIGGEGAEDVEPFTIYVEDLVSLFASRTLTCIQLDCVVLQFRHNPLHAPSTSVVDAVLQALERYQGPLEELHLPEDIRPLPPFDCLSQFSQSAPWLKELSLSVCPFPAEGITVPLGISLKNSLQQLSLHQAQNLARENPLTIARCIDSWFPNLVEVCFYDYSDHGQEFDSLRANLQGIRLSNGK
jgi:hypothetical protein